MKWINNIAGFLDRLTEPVVSMPDVYHREQAKLMASLLLAMTVLIVVVFPVRALVEWNIPQDLLRLAASSLSGVMTWIAYHWTRRGRIRAAITMLVIYGTLIIFVMFVAVRDYRSVDGLYYLAVMTIFASLFLSLRTTLFIMVMHLLIMVLLPIIMPNIVFGAVVGGPVLYSIIMTSLTLLFIQNQRRLDSLRVEQLRRSEDRYKLISELSSDYAFAIHVEPDGALRREWITDASVRVTGYGADEIVDFKDIDQFYHPDDIARLNQDVQEVLSGTTLTNDYRILTKSGDVQWVQIYRRPMWDEQHKRVVGYLGAVKDITEMKRIAEQQFLLAVDRERMEVMNQFVMAMSHDFRTSLSNIETSRYLLNRKLTMLLDPEDLMWIQDKLDNIHLGVTRMTDQLDNLSDVTSLSGLVFEEHDLNAMIHTLINRQMPKLEEYNLAVEFQPDEKLPLVKLDETAIMRVIRHLLVNAQNYTPSGGKLKVRTFCTERDAGIEVSDTGMGIHPENVRRVFDLFYREDESRSIRSGGMGLGLSIVKMIAEAHGGGIQVESALGEGSKFTLLLPLRRES